MATGQDLVTSALELIGVVSPADGSPSAEDSDVALRHLNLLVKRWNAQDAVLHAISRVTYTWPLSQSSRTIGPSGADLEGTRPLQILEAKAIPSGDTTEQRVNLLTHARYAGLPNKAQTARTFTDLLYEPTGAAIGTLTVWPVPTANVTLILHHKALLTAVELETDISMPEVYEDFAVTRLAKRLAPIFGKSWTREMQEEWRDATTALISSNTRVPDEMPMPAMPGGRSRSVSQAEYDAGLF